MRSPTDPHKLSVANFYEPKTVVLVLTFILWLAVWFVVDPGHSMSFWHSHYWDSTLLLIAAFFLCVGKAPGYVAALILSGHQTIGMGWFVLGLDRLQENLRWHTLPGWWKLMLEAHPQYIVHAVLGAIILIWATTCLIRMICSKRAIL
jgi:hypothetical protein